MEAIEQDGCGAGCAHGIWDDQSARRLKTAYHEINIIKRIEGFFQREGPLRVIEFGPGMGCLFDLVRSRWPETNYHVADVDAGLLADLSGRLSSRQTHFLQGSESLENIAGSFDVIAAVDVWEHLELAEALAYTKWCWQRLTPGGVMILQAPNWGCPTTPYTFFNDLTHCTPLNEESIRQLFQSAGIPMEAISVFPRKTPGVLGFFRDGLNGFFGLFYRLFFVFFGAVRLKVFSADLVAVVCKPDE